MKKAIGQTVRDLKREVNKKVLKVSGIEQKVLDATSNEAWGPHGSLLADIAQASKNYHEHQKIMAILWKRINDTGKNWRHVYKALIVLEYLVGHGSEQVIDDIGEHAHQISTLSGFQYIDSSGRDQGNNVRKKSQTVVLLVNDKERIMEVRQKAAANRNKFHNNSSGGMYRPGSYSGSGPYGDRYEDDRFGSREEDRSGYGYSGENELGYREDDRYGHDGDRYARDYEEYYYKDNHRDDEYRERSQSVDDHQYGSRSRNYVGDHDRSYNDDGQHSIRLEQKLSEQNRGAPPSYEEALGEFRCPSQNKRDVETSAASAPRGFSPVSDDPRQTSAYTGSAPLVSYNPTEAIAAASTATSRNQEVEASDEFDPRGPVSVFNNMSNFTLVSSTVETSDGVKLRTRLFKPGAVVVSNNDLAIVLVHPYSILGGSQGLLKGIASGLAHNGYKAVTFDMRGVGRSTGNPSLTGFAEVKDIIGVCKWLSDTHSVRRILLVGSSAGAPIAGSAVDQIEQVIGYVSIGYPFGMTASILFGRHHKAILQSPKPKLFIMGTKDGFTSVKQLKNKLSSAAGCVETHLIEGAGHFEMEGSSYDAQMTDLIIKFIASL